MVSEKQNKITVARGATVPGLQNYSSERLDIEVTVDIPVGMTVPDAARELKESLDQVLNEFRSEFKPSAQVPGSPPPLPPGYQTAASAATQLPASAEPTPELSPSYLDGLPWRTETWGQWIFSDTAGAKALSEALAKESVLTIGSYQYKISKGRDKDFINRFQAKKP